MNIGEELYKWQQKHFEGIGYILDGSGWSIGRTTPTERRIIMEDYPLDDNTLFPMIMECSKCGKLIWEGTSTCPCCGCDVNFTIKKKD